MKEINGASSTSNLPKPLANAENSLIQFAKGLSEQDQLIVYSWSDIINSEELQKLSKDISSFLQQWQSHNQKVQSSSTFVLEQMVVIAIDNREGAGGCAKDKLLSFLASVGKKYGLNSVESPAVLIYDFARHRFKAIDLYELSRLKNRNNESDTSSVKRETHWLINVAIKNVKDLREKGLFSPV